MGPYALTVVIWSRAAHKAASAGLMGGAAAMSPHPAVSTMAARVVRAQPWRSAILLNTSAPKGRFSSIATMTSAPPCSASEGPATVTMAGANAVSGRNKWMLSIQFPTAPTVSADLAWEGRTVAVERLTGPSQPAAVPDAAPGRSARLRDGMW